MEWRKEKGFPLPCLLTLLTQKRGQRLRGCVDKFPTDHNFPDYLTTLVLSSLPNKLGLKFYPPFSLRSHPTILIITDELFLVMALFLAIDEFSPPICGVHIVEDFYET